MTDDITAYSSADLFSAVGKTTNVIVRFSLVTGLPGSPEWLRDPRGFAVKFYTQQGNWDLVGNNLPVRCLPRAWQTLAVIPAPGLNQQPARVCRQAFHAAEQPGLFVFSLHRLVIVKSRGKL